MPSVAQGNAGQTRWWGKRRRLSLPTDGQVLYLSTSYERRFQLAALKSPSWHGDRVVKSGGGAAADEGSSLEEQRRTTAHDIVNKSNRKLLEQGHPERKGTRDSKL